MDSFASKSGLTHKKLRYLAVCLATGAGLACAACASDDSEEESQSEPKTSEDKKDTAKPASDETAKSDENENEAAEKQVTDEEFAKEFSPEAQAKRAEEANPGIGAVMRYDGNWKGTTSQDQPVTLKVLNRFIGHLEIGYKLEGDGCEAKESLIKFSAMLGARGGMFSYMNPGENETLMISGKFTTDDEGAGEFSVEATGDLPEGCEANLSGTWKATKQ